VTLVVDNVAMGQGFLQVLRSFPVSITAHIDHTHSFYPRRYITLLSVIILRRSYPDGGFSVLFPQL